MAAQQKKILAIALSFDVIIIDQLSKYLILKFWPHLASVNYNIAFNIPIPNMAMLFIAPALILVFAAASLRYFSWQTWFSVAAAGFIAGGGVSNLIDRFFRNGVLDFIDFGFWPSFNLADAFIATGAFLIIFFHARILTDG